MNVRTWSAAPCMLVGTILVLFAVIPGCLTATAPVVSVDHGPKAGIAPLAVSFSVNASDPGMSVTWDFGDGTTGSGLRVEHVYADPGEYSAAVRWTRSGGGSGNQSGLLVSVYDPRNLPGSYSVGNLSSPDMLYLSTLQKKVDLFDQYYIEYTYMNKSHATAMRYTSRDFQFAMNQSLAQLDSIEISSELGPMRESSRVLFTNASEGAYAEFLAGVNLEKGDAKAADSYLDQAKPKMEIAKAERDRLVTMLEGMQ